MPNSGCDLSVHLALHIIINSPRLNCICYTSLTFTFTASFQISSLLSPLSSLLSPLSSLMKHCRRPRGDPRQLQGLLRGRTEDDVDLQCARLPRAHGDLALRQGRRVGPPDRGEAGQPSPGHQGGPHRQARHQAAPVHRDLQLHLQGRE